MTDQSVPKEVCQLTDRIIKDDVCYGKFNGELATSISTLCSDKSRLSGKNCKQFCDNQVGSKGTYAGACKTGASSYCEDSNNKKKPECACIVYKDTKEYKDLVDKYGQSLATVNPQCWVSACLNDTWSEQMTSYTGTCPNAIQICAQSLSVSDLTAAAIGSIGSTCNLDSTQGSTTVITGATPKSAPSTKPPSDLPTNSKTKPNPSGLNFISGSDRSTFIYTDKKDDPNCATNWNYYNSDGKTLILGNIPNITKDSSNKNFCLLNQKPDGFNFKSGSDKSTFIYTDKKDDPNCATNWNYYKSDGKTLIKGNIANITKDSSNKNFCLLKPVPPPAASPPASSPSPSTPPPKSSPPPSTTPSGMSSTTIAGIVIIGIVLLLLLFMLLKPKAPPPAAPIILGR